MLREVTAALERGDRVAALRIAIACWRQNRAPCIGDAIDVISADAKFYAPPVEDFHAAWLELATANDRSAGRAADPAAIAWLLDTLEVELDQQSRRRGGRVVTDLGERVSVLARLAPDPRVATAVIALLEPPADGSKTSVMPWATFRPALETIVEHADVRHIEQLRAVMAAPRGSDRRIREGLRAWVPQFVDRLTQNVTVPVDDADAWRALVPSTAVPISADHFDRLLAAIHADPDDDAQRLVYADLLQTVGDPRGEFIALQMTPLGDRTAAMADRLAELFAAHRTEWLGPDLSAVFEDVVFERGFLAEATIASHAASDGSFWALAFRDKRISTLHTLRTSRAEPRHLRAFVLSPETRSLRRVDVGTPEAVEALATIDTASSIRHLGIGVLPTTEEMGRIAEAKGLANVDELTVAADPASALLLLDSLGQFEKLSRVRVLNVAGIDTSDRPLLRARAKRANPQLRLTFLDRT